MLGAGQPTPDDVAATLLASLLARLGEISGACSPSRLLDGDLRAFLRGKIE